MLKYKSGKVENFRNIDDDWSTEPGVIHFTEADFLGLIEKAAIRSSWDFNYSTGDSVHDKIESLMLQTIPNVTEMIVSNLEKPQKFWVAAPSGIAVSMTTWAVRLGYKQIKMGGREPIYLGLLFGRWKLYDVPIMPSDIILIGYGEEINPPEGYATIKLFNWSF